MNYKFPALFIVSTPIGNMEDVTIRAINVLKMVDVIACEDTRTTKKLLAKYDIKTKTISLHKFNEQKKTDFIIEEIKSGKNYAYVSEAGTPGISDPGYLIVKKGVDSNINIYPIPGVSAPIAAIAGSGLPNENFIFEGFLHYKKNKRKEQLDNALKSPYTTVFFESPHRIISSLEMLCDLEPDREICIAREMTKLHEEFTRGKVYDLLKEFIKKDKIKGEFTLIIKGFKKKKSKIGG